MDSRAPRGCAIGTLRSPRPPWGRAERSGARLASGATEVLGFIAFLDVNWDVLGSSLFFYEAFLLGFLLGFLPGF